MFFLQSFVIIYLQHEVMKVNESKGKLLVYNLPNGKAKVDVLLSQDNIWMSQTAIADLYQTSVANINMHIKHIY